MAPANAAAPAASQCHGVPRDEFDARFAMPARERGRREWRVDPEPAAAADVAAPRLSERHAQARPEALHLGDGASVGKALPSGRRTKPAVSGLARAPSPVGRRSGEVGLGDDTCHVWDSVDDCGNERSRHDRDANAAVASLRRHRDVMRGVRGRRAGLRAQTPRRRRRAMAGIGGNATLAMRTCEAASTTSIRSAAGHAAGRSTALAHASAGGIEERPSFRAIRRGRGGEQNAQHRHVEYSWRARIAVVYSTRSLRSGHSTICQTIAGRAPPPRRTSARARECVAPWRASMVIRK